MGYIENLVSEIYNSSKIPFQLIVNETSIYSSPKFTMSENCIRKKLEYRNIKYNLIVSSEYGIASNLLIFCLKNKLNDIVIKKEDIIISLLNNKEIDKEIVNNIYPEINEKFQFINVFIDKYSEDIISCLKESYLKSNIEVILYNESILIIGNFKDILEHANSIKETINNEWCSKCYISYCEVYNYSYIKNCYEETLYKLQLAVKYNVSEEVFDEKKLILEGIVDSIPEEMKNKIFNSFSSRISELDNEMIKTIEVFFKCGLNLSDAARELYIHRNTLIYRLDKIQKVTSYDIREFNNAMLFKIILLYVGRKKQFNC